MTIGAIFGVILGGPLWYAALFGRPVPSSAPQVQSLLLVLLMATLHGVVRAFVWLPSLIYHVGVHKMGFTPWMFGNGVW
jgi:hypothetical protein